MIRQAQTYLTGAASSAGLVAAAVVGFILLLWINPFHGVPMPSLGFGPDTVTPAAGRAIAPAARRAGAPVAPAGRRAAARNNFSHRASGASNPRGRGGDTSGGPGVTPDGDLGAPAGGPAPQGPGREDTGSQGGGPAGSGGAGGSSGVQVGDTPVNST